MSSTVPLTSLLPIRFDLLGGVPNPHPNVEDPNPEEVFQAHVTERQAKIEETRENKVVPLPTSSLFSKAGAAVTNAVRSTTASVQELHLKSEAKIRTELAELQRKEFVGAFPTMATEELKGAYGCDALHYPNGSAAAPVTKSGKLYLCKGFVCFSSSECKVAIPFNKIVSIQKSVALPTTQGGIYVIPIPIEQVVYDSIQVYTSMGELYQFCNCSSITSLAGQTLSSGIKGRPVDRVYIWLEHLWRDTCVVPIPGIQYRNYQHVL